VTTGITTQGITQICFRSRKHELRAIHDWFRPRTLMSRNLRLFRRVALPAHADDFPYEPSRPRHLAGVNLTDAEVEEFKAIYERTTGKEISLATAREMATKLMTYVHALVRPRVSRKQEQA